MRKSNLSKSEIQDRNRKIMTIVVALFFIGTLVFGSFAFVFLMNPTGQIGFGGGQSTVQEFGQTFQIVEFEGASWWQTRFNGQDAYFYLLPSQLGIFPLDSQGFAEIQGAESVLITFDSSDSNVSVIAESVSLLSETLIQKDILPQLGSTQSENEFELDFITCEMATAQTPVLLIELDERIAGLIQTQDHCYTLSGFDGVELIYATEFLRYSLFGIQFE